MEVNIFGFKMRLEYILLCLALGFLISMLTVCSCSKVGIKEGLTSLADAAPLDYNNDGTVKDSWTNKALLYAKDMGYQNILDQHRNNKGTSVPLQDGNMLFFKDNAFKPECCPSTYSTSTGCPCISDTQIEYLNQRGGNRTSPTNF